MKLSVKGLAAAVAILWGACILGVGLINLTWPGYGGAFLDMVRSIYPGFQAMTGFAGVLTGTVYALVDGALCGAIVAWIYNMVSGTKQDAAGA